MFMKARIFALATLCLAGMSTPTWADCVYPKTPDSPPNGSTATETEMVAGVTAFKKYNAEVTAYLECLDTETNARITEAGDKADQVKQIKAMSNKKHNAAIDELEARAADINSQVRAFKAKQKS
jgi:precorrin-2 methylase